MSEKNDHSIVGLLLMLSLVLGIFATIALSMTISILRQNLLDLKKEAVKRSYGSYQPTENGHPEFKWKDENSH